jgi:putative Holliday junction resolvase
MPEVPSSPSVVLGFDFGVKRIGVAIGQTLTGQARPLRTIVSVPVAQRFASIAALIEAWQPACLVVGRPLDEAGDVTPTTGLVERFANQLRGRFGLPVAFVDERFSSREAQAMIAAGAARRDQEDAVAAAVILNQWLDAQAGLSSRGGAV